MMFEISEASARTLPYFERVKGVLEPFATLVAAVWAVLMLRSELRRFEQTTRIGHYTELDKMYSDILVRAMERPYLRDPASIRDFVAWLRSRQDKSRPDNSSPPAMGPSDVLLATRAREYDLYAFMTMNFVETIRDKCIDCPHSLNPLLMPEPDSALQRTWEGIIGVECTLHRDWFLLDTTPWCTCHQEKFCMGFCDFVWHFRWREPITKWQDRDSDDIRRDGDPEFIARPCKNPNCPQ